MTRTGAVGSREFGIALALPPFALFGRRVGQHLHNRVDQTQFRRITLVLLVPGTSGVVIASPASCRSDVQLPA